MRRLSFRAPEQRGPRDDGTPLRGIIVGVILSVPLWVIIFLIFM